MNKFFIFFLFNLLIVNHVFTQPINGQKISKWDNQIFLSDINGRPLSSRYTDVEGHPFFKNRFIFGNIELKNGRKLTGVPMKIDLVTHDLIFTAADKQEGYIGADDIHNVFFIDSTEIPYQSYFFSTKFAAVDQYADNQFALILTEGKMTLIKRMRKKIDTRKNDLSGEISKEFALYEDYYILTNNSVKRLKREKSAILEILNEKRAEIDIFFRNNKPILKKDEDLANIFIYYNNL